MDNSKRTGAAMNQWLRAAAGYGPDPDQAVTEAQPRHVDANAGNGARQTGIGRETSSQRVNRFIRQMAGRGWA